MFTYFPSQFLCWKLLIIKTETYNYIQSCTCIFLRKLIFQYRALKCKNVKAIRAAHVLHVVYKWVIKKRFSNYTCMANHVHKSQSLLWRICLFQPKLDSLLKRSQYLWNKIKHTVKIRNTIKDARKHFTIPPYIRVSYN